MALLIWLPVLAVAAVLAVVLLSVLRGSGPSESDLRRDAERVLAARGSMRCVLAEAFLRRLARAEGTLIARHWEELELPLLEALPDCPPQLKSALSVALELVHRACPVRDSQRRMIEMRNGLLSGEADPLVR